MPLRCGTFALIAVVCICVAGCDKKTRRLRIQGIPSGDVRVSPGDRLGWAQQAPDAAEIATFQFALYVDGSRTTLASVSCAQCGERTAFDCSAVLPTLSTGTHTLELASFVVDGSVTIESARSGALRVVAGGTSTSTFSAASMLVVTAEQVQLNLVPVAEGLNLPSDLAFASDGSIFVAERGGVVRLIRDGGSLRRRRSIFLRRSRAGGRASRDSSRPELRQERSGVYALRRGRATQRARVHARAIPLSGRRVPRARGAARSDGGVGDRRKRCTACGAGRKVVRRARQRVRRPHRGKLCHV